MKSVLDPTQKAFSINLDDRIYGTFAEIGAGQEVARYFFRAGGAAGTIAKSMSAYDMAVSDDIYGKSGRYVSQERLETMLAKEFDQLQERLSGDRGEETCFFAFADTVAAKSFQYTAECHGWLGVRFQHEPGAEPSQITVHVRMHDRANLQQQEVLGVLGTNLVYNCFRTLGKREEFVESLMDNIGKERLSVDVLEVSGPGFESEDHRLWSLELVKRGFTKAVLFDECGNMSRSQDAFYKKNILVSRGSYRPPTHVNIDMLSEGKRVFSESLKREDKSIADAEMIVLPEISMNKLKERGEVDSEDFLARVDLISALGHSCLITNFPTYGGLSQYLSDCTNHKIAFVLGYHNLKDVFAHQEYGTSIGGLFSALGELLGERTQLFVYPAQSDDGKKVLSIKDAEVTDIAKPLISYLREQNKMTDIKDFNKDHFTIWSRTVLKMIQNKEAGWEQMVPESVAKEVKEKCLFEYPCEVK